MSNSNDNVRTELSNFLKKKFGEAAGRELFVEFINKLDELSNAERDFMWASFRDSEAAELHEMKNVWIANCNLVEVVMKLLQKQ